MRMHWSSRWWITSALIGCLLVSTAIGHFDHTLQRQDDAAQDGEECDVSDAPTAREIHRVVTAILDLGLSVYRSLAAASPGHTNILVSPASLALTLANLALGAHGSTKRELLNLLGLQSECEHRFLKFIFGSLDVETTMLASQLFLRKAKLRADFGAKLRRFYGTGARELAGASAQRDADAMNRWVATHTGRHILNLVEELSEDARLVLLSALYFKGEWVTKFDPDNTVQRPFFLSSGRTKTVPMIFSDSYPFFVHATASSPYQFLELPFRNGTTFVAVTPSDRSASGFEHLERRLTSSDLAAGLARGAATRMALALPRLHLHERVELIHALRSLAPEAFSSAPDLRLSVPRDAGDAAGGAGAAAVSTASHAALLALDEAGVTAAAATALAAARAAHEVALDGPFLFVLRDTASGGVPLLLGRVVDPDPGAPLDPLE